MKILTSRERKRLARYRKAWRKRLPEERKAKIRAYHKEWMRKWRLQHPERARASNRRAYLVSRQKEGKEKTKLKDTLSLVTRAVPEETLPGHCKRCGILLSERGTPDGHICFGCHDELSAAL